MWLELQYERKPGFIIISLYLVTSVVTSPLQGWPLFFQQLPMSVRKNWLLGLFPCFTSRVNFTLKFGDFGTLKEINKS